jgi:uncharacterized protein (DUF1800 family)
MDVSQPSARQCNLGSSPYFLPSKNGISFSLSGFEKENLMMNVEQSSQQELFPSSTVLAGASALALAACASSPENSGSAPPDATQAAVFLGKAGFGANKEELARVQTIGLQPWLQEQFALPRETAHWDWMVAKAYNAPSFMGLLTGFDNTAWRQLITSKDVLRQRVTLALSEIIVVSLNGLVGYWRNFNGAAYLDVLADNAFGNYRTILDKVSMLPAMGLYLTFVGNIKANPTTGTQPDENYARELMQLFTIGLYQLNLDGTLQKDASGKPIETYAQEDISGLARVFTGWVLDGADATTPDRMRKAMVQAPTRHELGAKTFLGTTIPAGTDGVQSLKLALDAIYAHPNVAPFISKQLIQRLVVSNPSPAYVQRVATVFNNNGSGVKGDMKAVISAILTDSEALTPPATSAGKLREPIVRFVSWARVFGATSPTDLWDIGNTSDPGSRLAQSPGHSESVFNFFRPGYVPPGTAIAQQGLVAPELQITNESSVAGYLNYMQTSIQNGRGEVKANYADWVPLAGDAQRLLDQINLQLAGGAVSAATISTIKTAVETISMTTANGPLQRVQAAILLVMAAPEYIVQK